MGINPLPAQFLQFMCWVGESMDVSLQWYKISDIVVAWHWHQYPDSLSACVTLPSVVRWKYFCNMIVQIFSCTSSASQEIHSLVAALVRGNIIAVVGKLFSSSEIFLLLQLWVECCQLWVMMIIMAWSSPFRQWDLLSWSPILMVMQLSLALTQF